MIAALVHPRGLWMNQDDFKQGMRRLLAGVSLVTTHEDDISHGFIATAVTSVSAEPPRLLVCVNKAVTSHDVLHRSGALCVNLLGREHEPLSRRFSTSHLRESRFAEGNWTTLETGAPVLSDALASFDCRIGEIIPAHSHTIFICDILAIRYGGADRAPLAYYNGRYVSARDL